MRFHLSWELATSALRTVLLFAVRSFVPSLLTLSGPLVFFGRGTFAALVWLFLILAWLLLLAIVELVRGTSRSSYQMRVRQVLATFRLLTNNAWNRLSASQERGDNATASLAAAFDHDTVMSEIMGAIFSVISSNNADLEKHFRVTFMEVLDEALWIRYYANTDNERPETMAKRLAFAHGEGIAGRALATAQPVIIADVKRTDMFAFKTEPHREYRIRSLVSIPVSISSPDGSTEVIGVLNVDSDQPNFFQETASGKRAVEVTVRPFVRIIRLLYASRQALTPSGAPPHASAAPQK